MNVKRTVAAAGAGLTVTMAAAVPAGAATTGPGEPLLRPAQQKEMTDLGTIKEYGLGLEAGPLPCGTARGHGGGTHGYSTVAFSSADGSRQLALSMTPYSGDPEKAAMTMLVTPDNRMTAYADREITLRDGAVLAGVNP
ncbi:hypothetical protein HCN51_24100 [Nonomuraea sp. FMUSA5-5]|uniref:Uncharacterized protein n=1 Tax=Nonomuraea composti TaxID=2720023 RepID=A0ABX1B519_9ACTN|nr:hypothetical protein [Nonomuraea sp. FMUSA5-5]NJP92516.1 hypothetical protein [Nonomuraea sp. FMUSA5-5]